MTTHTTAGPLAPILLLVLSLVGCASVPTPEAIAPPPAVAAAAPPVVRPPTPPPPPPPRQAEAPLPPIDAAAERAANARKRLDPGVDGERADLWQRVRNGFALTDLEHELVRKWEQHYAARPDYVARMTERGGRYLFHIVEEVDRRGLPMELALLPFIESAFNPQAMSRAAASGMWQFMPATGRSFELKQNVFRDDRRDVLASTRAALDYLQKLHERFGSWPLALAAYNWGQGNVNRALTTLEQRGQPRDAMALPRMPQETREYVPKLLAMKNIVMRPQAFGLTLPPLENHPFFQTVAIDRDIDVALAARLAGLSLEAFQQLNPQLNKPVILAAGTPQVLLPYDNANQFLRTLRSHDGALASWTAWRAPKTLKPAEAAKLVGMSEDSLREVNLIPARMLVQVGSILVVPRSARNGGSDVAEHVADNGMLALTPEQRARAKAIGKATNKANKAPGKATRKATPAPSATKASRRQSPSVSAKAGSQPHRPAHRRK